MANDLFMGIDGGGSTARAVIAPRTLEVIASSRINSAANPNYAGRDNAQASIREAMRMALDEAHFTADDIRAVGIGVAGAVDKIWEPWLRETVLGVTPNALVRTSGDMAIALAGARGEPFGVIVVAGTGSVIYGQNRAGEHKMIGGWGIALGDEGSGNWLGREGVRAVMAADDSIGPETTLTAALLDHLQAESARDLIAWVYQEGAVRADRIATLAPVVMRCADQGDAVARQIIDRGVDVLAHAISTALRLLQLDRHTVAYAGSLLENPTPLRAALGARLDIDPPPARFPPVVGAALLAVTAFDAQRHS